MVAVGIAALEEALQAVVEVPAPGGGLIRLVAPEAREIGPVAREFRRRVDAFTRGNAEFAALESPTPAQRAAFERDFGGMFADAIVDASVGALIACVRDPGDPAARLSPEAARALQAAQDTQPTDQAAWRSALKLCRIIDLDEYDRKVAEAEKIERKAKGKRRGSGEAAAPAVDFPPSTNSRR